jgi:hypothetical protein
MSANAPAGNVNKKKGRDAAVDNKERNKGDGVMVFMTQVAAMSWAETQHPETTLASQSLEKTGFRSASQIECGFLLIGWVQETKRVIPQLNSLFGGLETRSFLGRIGEGGIQELREGGSGGVEEWNRIENENDDETSELVRQQFF